MKSKMSLCTDKMSEKARRVVKICTRAIQTGKRRSLLTSWCHIWKDHTSRRGCHRCLL